MADKLPFMTFSIFHPAEMERRITNSFLSGAPGVILHDTQDLPFVVIFANVQLIQISEDTL